MLLKQGGKGLDDVERPVSFSVLQKSWGQWQAAVAAAALHPHTFLPVLLDFMGHLASRRIDHFMVNPPQFSLGHIVAAEFLSTDCTVAQ